MIIAWTFEQIPNMELIHTSKPVKLCVQFHSKLGNGCFTSLFDGILRFFISGGGRMRQK